MTEPFGALRPSSHQERIRAIGRRLPQNYFGRKAASLLLGAAGGRARRAYDVEVFGSQKARLHPFDNICEKRIYLTPQHWDAEERALLAARIAAHDKENFIFADIGANVGLYTLFARAEALRAGKRIRSICVEPDPEMRARLSFNIAASGAGDDVSILPFAATNRGGALRFSVNRGSRGMSRIDTRGDIEIEGRTLASLLSGAPRLDAMKIDIEGHEYETLTAFFSSAPRALLPRTLIMEISHETAERSATALALGEGYRVALKTGLNAVFVLD